MLIDILRTIPSFIKVKDMMRALDTAMVYEVSDVANVYFDTKPLISSLPNMMPKYPEVWMEFDTRKMREDLSVRLVGEGFQAFFGALIRTEFEYGLCSALMVFYTGATSIPDLVAKVDWSLRDGGVLKDDDDVSFTYSRGTSMFDIDSSEVNNIGNACIPTFMLALSLANCKNVEIVERRPERNIRKGTKMRKIRKEAVEHALSEHRKIIIEPYKLNRKYTAPSFSSKSGYRMRKHVYPGMFKTYGGVDPITGESKGKLFGKYSGTFWFNPHVRGGARPGKLTKEYKFRIGEQDAS